MDQKTPFKIPNRKFRHISSESSILFSTSVYLRIQLGNNKEVEIEMSYPIAHISKIIMLATKMRGAQTCREMATVR